MVNLINISKKNNFINVDNDWKVHINNIIHCTNVKKVKKTTPFLTVAEKQPEQEPEIEEVDDKIPEKIAPNE